jgi:hypothetical protein
MIYNPQRRPDGTMPPSDPNPPALNPEIADYFRVMFLDLFESVQSFPGSNGGVTAESPSG